MKSIITGLIAAIGITSLSAQPGSDTLRISINGTELLIMSEDLRQLGGVDINGMLSEFSAGMTRVMSEYQKKTEDIEKRLKNGDITRDEADEEFEEVEEELEARVEELSAKIEEWGERMEAFGEDMERLGEDIEESGDSAASLKQREWTEEEAEQWERWAERWEDDQIKGSDTTRAPREPKSPHIIFDEDGIRIERRGNDYDIDIDNDRESYSMHEPQVGFHFGLNNMLTPSGELSGGGAEVRSWRSWTYDLEFAHKFRVGATSPFFIRYGLNVSWHNLETKESLVKFNDPDDGPSVAWQPRTDVTVNETEFDIVYLDIPLMFQLDFSGRKMDDGFLLGIGGYGGVRLSSERETEFTDFHGDKSEEILKNNFFSNPWRYGLMAQLGYKSFKVTAKYDMNPLFRSDMNTPDYHMASLTLGFAL